MQKAKSILVTGGAGFIGSALVQALNERGFENILISDYLGTDEKWRNLVPLKYADYLEADSLHEKVEQTPGFLKDFSHVYHLGACSATTEKDARYLCQNNYEYTKTLALAALQNEVRFLYASSAATYGDGSQGMSDQTNDLHKLRPLNMYGYSKHMFDLWARRQGISDKLIGLKYFNVFGPNENHKGDMRSLVAKAFAQIQETGEIGLFKSYHPDYQDGEQKRDFLYVKDAVKMTLHLSGNPQAGGLYNLGSGEANTWLTLARSIFDALGKMPSIRFIEMPVEIREKYQYYTCADISKLRKSGFTDPLTTLPEAVRDYVNGYLVPDKRLGE
ncbi:MAG: ADP-glyceromanno-heptose 6-epimerase [Opitutales bacterium]|nr:ADP-glyceromanno-heptose 6-epimerase [Opitutales bacterium]MCH8475215.1 ADP-glyceromanno-heptose 6-epimerase [Opitutales bacterium]